ncbi:hypothetical protein [Nodularia sp. NIES-3585]|nr:hypothetical protein [Nodularia sp. NIES-3585]
MSANLAGYRYIRELTGCQCPLNLTRITVKHKEGVADLKHEQDF